MLPTDKQARKERPMFSGLLAYFPDALAEVARVSHHGSQQHQPGEPMRWDRAKSPDHADCVMRHLTEQGLIDDDGMRHTAKLAWRALAMLQLELEAAQANGPEWENASLADSLRPDDRHGQILTSGFVHTPDLAEHTHKANQWLDGQAKKAEGLRAELGVCFGRVYISGPMRGYEEDNFPAFDLAAARFRSWMWTVINPADMDREDKAPMSQIDFAKRDTAALNQCTHIALLPGWEKSRGALAEFFYARWIGLKALDAETGKPLDIYSRHDICLAINRYLNGTEAK